MYRFSVIFLAVAMFAAVAGAAGNEAAFTLSVEEASGVFRKAEPCSGGVPLPAGMFRKGQPFAVFKDGREIPAQVLPLITRKDGSPRWVLVDFQDDLAAGKTVKYVLKAVEPKARPATPLKLVDGPDALTVDTGKMKFVISKTQPFGLFGSVTVAGKPVVSGGRLSYSEVFTKRTCLSDKPESVVVEYNGPMRATVCVRGRFIGDDDTKLRYAVRITAWAGKSSVHVKYAICNSNEDHYCFRSLKDSSISLKLAGKPSGTLLGAGKPIEAGADAWMAVGLKSRAAGAAKTSTGWASKAGEVAEGWIAAKLGGGTVFASDLYFAADPARKLAVKDGSLILHGVIERWGGKDRARPYDDKFRVLYDCSHLSSQYVLDFAAPAAPAELSAMAKAAAERAWITATPEAYMHGDATFSRNFGTQTDEMACYDKWNLKYKKSDAPKTPQRRYPRFFRGIDNHFDPEEDVVDHLAVMYMRTGRRSYWKNGRSWANYWTDLCAWRTDGWRWKDGGVWKRSGPKGNVPQRPKDPVTGIRNIMPTGDGGPDGRTFNMKRSGVKKLPIALSPGFVTDNYMLGQYKGCWCHNWSAGLFHWFAMTGDRDVMEAAIDRAEQGYDQEIRAFGRKPGQKKAFGRSFTRTSMNIQVARMFLPEDEFFIKASDEIAAIFLETKISEPRGFVNAGGKLRNGLRGGIKSFVGEQGAAAMKAIGTTINERTGEATDAKGRKWFVLSGEQQWQKPPQSRAMECYYRITGNEDAHDWVIAYGQAVARVLYQRHGNLDYSKLLVDFPKRGVAKDIGSWTTDPKTNPWAEGPRINSFLARFYPDVCARAYSLCGEPFLKKRAYDMLFGGTHRGYNAKKMYPLDKVIMWVNYNSDHDGQLDYMLRTFYIWAHERKDATPPDAVTDLAVAVTGEKAVVTFTAPADAGGKAVRYQVKCSDKPIVDYVKFLEIFNNFQEGEFTNWWMAANLSGEPTPQAPGTREHFTVSGVPAGAKYFMVRSFDDSSNRGAVSNLAEAGK